MGRRTKLTVKWRIVGSTMLASFALSLLTLRGSSQLARAAARCIFSGSSTCRYLSAATETSSWRASGVEWYGRRGQQSGAVAHGRAAAESCEGVRRAVRARTRDGQHRRPPTHGIELAMDGSSGSRWASSAHTQRLTGALELELLERH
jgi:hypothetical protein